MAAIAEQTLQGQLRASLEELSRPMASDTSRRLQRLVGLFRGIAALALLAGGLFYREPPVFGARDPILFSTTAGAYAIVAWIVVILQHRDGDSGRALVPLMLLADIVGITLLMHASGGISSGIGALLVVFVGAASLTLRGQHAYLAAAVSALAVLTEQLASYTLGLSGPNSFIPAGFLGAIIFLIASAAHPLASRLQESEALAHQRGIDLANLAQLNEYIIQHLRESIVVVDELGHIRLMNQSAAELLGSGTRNTGRALQRISPELDRIIRDWRTRGTRPSTPPRFIGADGSTQVNTYIAPLDKRDDGPILVFLEDAGLLSQKVQQTKLAALGRLSASIAHEIRNPVGALSHAGQLLHESPDIGDYERRLLDIIGTNSRRVSDIVDNVLQLSRREATNPELISLKSWTESFVAEFRDTLELDRHEILMHDSHDIEVRMDPGQLYQICWNLCENAVRYGESHGGVCVELHFGRLTGSGRPYLEVADRGPGIPTEMRDHLFEPFATGRVGGTGLGLFVSRELCECNRAALIFEDRDGGGSVFRVVFADPDRWGAAA